MGVCSDLQQRTLSIVFSVAPYRARSRHMQCSKSRLFNHLVGHRKQLVCHNQAERLCRGQVYDEIELCRLLDRDVGTLCSAENLVDIVAGSPEQVCEVWSIEHQTSRFDELPKTVHRRQSCAQRQGIDAHPVEVHERITDNIKCVEAVLAPLDGGCNSVRSPDFEGSDFESERASG